MFLHSLASAVPPFRVTQREALDRIRTTARWQALRPRSRSLVETVLTGDSGILARHVTSTDAIALESATADELNRAFEIAAPALAAEALRKAMVSGGVSAGEIDALFLCTCTGYLCPGPSSHLAEQIGLRDDVVLHDLVGLGCGAAIPTLRAASHFLAARPEAIAAVVAVEVCSTAFFLNDEPDVLISLCLFGDGASASLWRGSRDNAATRWRVHDFRSLHQPAEREKIRFVTEGGKLKNQLHRSVPALAGAAVQRLFKTANLPPDVRVVAHAGGRDVITAVQGALPGHPLAETSAVLREHGNMSSPSVLFALEKALAAGVTDPLWLTSFGAGFSAHACRMDHCGQAPRSS
jgi:predicted naringenin-chalcone synthase